MQKQNDRTCIFTKQKLSKNNLIRFVVQDNQILIDQNHQLKGRGYYLSNDNNVLLKVKSTKYLEKRFKANAEEFFKKIL